MIDRHISDDRLIDICAGGTAIPGERAHLSACMRCGARRTEVVGILTELDAAATQEAGIAFPEARLERQHARILQRVDHDGRPAQVVAFPSSYVAARTPMSSRPHMRWAAAVAAAAFIAGVLTGQWSHDFTRSSVPAPTHIIANETGETPLRAVSTTFSEEEFLGQVEVAASRGPAALRPLDAMTPRAWEVR
jgi:hypothetical protein